MGRARRGLAAAVGADAAALYRLFWSVATTRVVIMEADGRSSLSSIGELLRADVPGSLRALLVAETAPGHWRPWGKMEHGGSHGAFSVV